MSRHRVKALAAAVVGLCAAYAPADVPIYGGGTYSPSTGGYLNPYSPIWGGSALIDGVAIGGSVKYNSNGDWLSSRALRWDQGGNFLELELLGQSSSGVSASTANSIHPSGTIVGWASKYSQTHTDLGPRAVTWNSAGEATELEPLSVNGTGYGAAFAMQLTAGGRIVGTATKYSPTGQHLGQRPVQWNAQGEISEMQILGTDGQGYASYNSLRFANESGYAAGSSIKYFPDGSEAPMAVRWDPAGQITLLDGLHPTYYGESGAFHINASLQTVGFSPAFSSTGQFLGEWPVRWEASGAATPLESLGSAAPNDPLKTNGRATRINDAGVSVGAMEKFDASMARLGLRAVKWNTAGNIIELPTLGTSAAGSAEGEAFGINAAGDIVGYVEEYDALGNLLGERAMFWGADGSAIRLIDLIDSSSGWIELTHAYGITDNLWITGEGLFDPDGIGGQAPYERGFLMHVPEPGGICLLALGLPCVRLRVRGNRN